MRNRWQGRFLSLVLLLASEHTSSIPSYYIDVHKRPSILKYPLRNQVGILVPSRVLELISQTRPSTVPILVQDHTRSSVQVVPSTKGRRSGVLKERANLCSSAYYARACELKTFMSGCILTDGSPWARCRRRSHHLEHANTPLVTLAVCPEPATSHREKIIVWEPAQMLLRRTRGRWSLSGYRWWGATCRHLNSSFVVRRGRVSHLFLGSRVPRSVDVPLVISM